MLFKIYIFTNFLQIFVVFNHRSDLFEFYTKLFFVAIKLVHELHYHIVFFLFVLLLLCLFFLNHRKICSTARVIELVTVTLVTENKLFPVSKLFTLTLTR
jgi:hypothetical protein